MLLEAGAAIETTAKKLPYVTGSDPPRERSLRSASTGRDHPLARRQLPRYSLEEVAGPPPRDRSQRSQSSGAFESKAR